MNVFIYLAVLNPILLAIAAVIEVYLKNIEL